VNQIKKADILPDDMKRDKPHDYTRIDDLYRLVKKKRLTYGLNTLNLQQFLMVS
jgi:hypothetical protein